MDGALENKSFKVLCKNKGFNKKCEMKFEKMAPRTPQKNKMVNRKFPTLTGRVQAMMNRAHIYNENRYKFWGEAEKMATDLDGIMMKPKDKMGLHEKFFGDP